MLSTKDAAIVYETLLSSPGMNDAVKIEMRIPRKMVLLLTKVIESGLAIKNEDAHDGLLSIADKGTLEELKNISVDILRKAGLTEMNEKLNSLNTK
jgi:hypothetical protein